MRRIMAFVYGVVCYCVFFVTFLYAIGFVGNLLVPRSIDSGAAGPAVMALIVNLALLGLFAMQHSGMARQGFKRWWTRYVPQSVERSTYVLLSSLALILLYWLWQPLPELIWDVQNDIGAAVLWALFAAGWLIVLLSTFMTDHFDLFGLRQVYLHLRGIPYTPPPFRQIALYRYVRHPIMAGFIIAFWATLQMSAGHLLFAVVTTLYILAGVYLEERDLLRVFGERYAQYRQQVPMLIPGLKRRP